MLKRGTLLSVGVCPSVHHIRVSYPSGYRQHRTYSRPGRRFSM